MSANALLRIRIKSGMTKKENLTFYWFIKIEN